MLVIKGSRSFELGSVKLGVQLSKKAVKPCFSPLIKSNVPRPPKEGLLWIELISLRLDFLLGADILEVF